MKLSNSGLYVWILFLTLIMPAPAAAAPGVKAISAGFHLGLRTDVTLWSWGNRSYGALGLGDDFQRNVPTLVRFQRIQPWMLLLLD